MTWGLDRLFVGLRKMISEFRRDDRGSVAVIFSVSVATLIGICGVALDYGRAASAQRRLAAATDAAALAAVVAPEPSRADAAMQLFKSNYSGPVQPQVESGGDTVTVSASDQITTFLSQVLGTDHLPIAARSVARIGAANIPPQCILLLEPADTGLYVNSDSRLDADCGIQVNSMHTTEALLANSNGHIAAARIHVSGTSRLNSGSTATPLPVDGKAGQTDPLLDMPEPAIGACNFTDFTVNTGQTVTMVPGVYCGNTVINSGATATLQPGLYSFRDGEFLINSLSRVTGAEVMLHFTGTNARLIVNSDSDLQITAPASGTYAGILVFQSRATATTDAPAFTINSNGTTRIEGTVYLPRGVLIVNSHSTANQTASYTAIVAQKLVLNSLGTLTVRSDFESATPLPPLLRRFRAVTLPQLIN